MLIPTMDKLVSRVEALRQMCLENLKSKEIREISVELPTPPFDELYFRKTVAWCYVLFHETGPFIRFSGKLLRANPPASEAFGKTKQFIDCARTAHAHNLSKDQPGDQAKKRTYDIWISEHGGAPTDWENCCHALLNEAEHILVLIEDAYATRCADQTDREALWESYKQEKLTFWEAHEFDPFVEKAAKEMDIDGLNCTQFRNAGKRVDQWRILVAMFDTREAAEKAIERAIRSELINVFGCAP